MPLRPTAVVVSKVSISIKVSALLISMVVRIIMVRFALVAFSGRFWYKTDASCSVLSWRI